MTSVRIDTLEEAGELRDAGIEREHAEAIVSANLRSSAAWEDALVTKSDLATFQQGVKSEMETFQHSSQSESATLRTESETFRSGFEGLRSDVTVLRTDVDALRSDFGRLRIEFASDLAKLETKLTNRMFVMSIGIIGATTALVKLI